MDLRLLKNKIVVLNLSANKNISANTYQSSIYDLAEVAVQKENPIDIKTKKAVEVKLLNLMINARLQKKSSKAKNHIKIRFSQTHIIQRKNSRNWTS